MSMTTAMTGSPRRLILSTSSILGSEVTNDEREALGRIHELMIDTADGAVTYAVLAIAADGSLSQKLLAVPWPALRLNHQNKVFLLDVSKQRLSEAPGFDEEHWPDMADAAWADTIEEYYRASAPQRYDG